MFLFQVSERYAFVPREAVTKFLVLCTECPRRSVAVVPTSLSAVNNKSNQINPALAHLNNNNNNNKNIPPQLAHLGNPQTNINSITNHINSSLNIPISNTNILSNNSHLNNFNSNKSLTNGTAENADSINSNSLIATTFSPSINSAFSTNFLNSNNSNTTNFSVTNALLNPTPPTHLTPIGNPMCSSNNIISSSNSIINTPILISPSITLSNRTESKSSKSRNSNGESKSKSRSKRSTNSSSSTSSTQSMNHPLVTQGGIINGLIYHNGVVTPNTDGSPNTPMGSLCLPVTTLPSSHTGLPQAINKELLHTPYLPLDSPYAPTGPPFSAPTGGTFNHNNNNITLKNSSINSTHPTYIQPLSFTPHSIHTNIKQEFKTELPVIKSSSEIKKENIISSPPSASPAQTVIKEEPLQHYEEDVSKLSSEINYSLPFTTIYLKRQEAAARELKWINEKKKVSFSLF